MAKTTGFLSETSGKLNDNFQTRQTANGTILARSPRKTSTPRRSEKQMWLRTQLGNIAANNQLYAERHLLAFEGKPSGMSEYNMMVQVNYGVTPVFITKTERLNGGCVVADYQFCRGSLNSIAVAKNAGGVAVSDVALGGLVIGAETTVAEFSVAVLANNSGWEDYDQITFFYAKQTRDAVSNVPRATMDSWKVVLDVNDESVLLEKVSEVGFTSVDGYLGMSEALVSAGCAWVHSRENNGSGIKVGSQRLFVENELLAYYRSDAAKKAAYDSYGGVNTRAVYLKPESSISSVTGSSGTSSSGGDTSGSSAGSSGSDSGSQTETVEAPVISGTTPFSESTSVTISGPEGATIYYTTDGSNPTAESTVYSEAFSLTETATVKAIAIKNGVSSTVAEKGFTKSSGEGGFDTGS